MTLRKNLRTVILFGVSLVACADNGETPPPELLAWYEEHRATIGEAAQHRAAGCRRKIEDFDTTLPGLERYEFTCEVANLEKKKLEPVLRYAYGTDYGCGDLGLDHSHYPKAGILGPGEERIGWIKRPEGGTCFLIRTEHMTVRGALGVP
ncbi:MAG: hypothetical protein AAGA56_21625 [Myxococcota bacterium]